MRTPALAGEGPEVAIRPPYDELFDSFAAPDVRRNRANGLWQIALVPKLQFGAPKPLEEVTRTRQGGTFAI